MTNVTFTTTKVASDFQSQQQLANFAVGHFAPAFSNTGITVDFQASNIDWTGAVRSDDLIDTNQIIGNVPNITVLGNGTSYGLTAVTLQGKTPGDESALPAFSLITISGNTGPQGNIFTNASANFSLAGFTYPSFIPLTAANANFTISGTTSNIGSNSTPLKYYFNVNSLYSGNVPGNTSIVITQTITIPPYGSYPNSQIVTANIGNRNSLITSNAVVSNIVSALNANNQRGWSVNVSPYVNPFPTYRFSNIGNPPPGSPSYVVLNDTGNYVISGSSSNLKTFTGSNVEIPLNANTLPGDKFVYNQRTGNLYQFFANGNAVTYVATNSANVWSLGSTFRAPNTLFAITKNDFNFIGGNSANSRQLHIYNRANSNVITQTITSNLFPILDSQRWKVCGNNIVFGCIDSASGTPAGSSWKFEIYTPNTQNVNSYVLNSSITNTGLNWSSGTQDAPAVDFFLASNANSFITFYSYWTQFNTIRPRIKRYSKNGSVWTAGPEQVTQLDRYNQRNTYPQRITFTDDLSRFAGWPQGNSVVDASIMDANSYGVGTTIFPSTLSGATVGLWPGNSLDQYKLAAVDATNTIVYLRNGYYEYGNTITINTGQYFTPNYQQPSITPTITGSNTTIVASAARPVIQNQPDIIRFSSNAANATYQLPYDANSNVVNSYIANLSVPGYVYNSTGANTFQLTRTQSGLTPLTSLVNVSIKLSDNLTNSNAIVTRTSYSLGQDPYNFAQPQLRVTIANTTYSGNLPYNTNTATLTNFPAIITIPGYTVSTLSLGNFRVENNSSGLVSNITSNIYQETYPNITPPVVTRNSFNNGQTATVPDPISPTMSIDFGNSFGYSPDPFIVILPWNSNANVVANTVRSQSLIGANISGTGPNININALSIGIQTEPNISFGGNGSSNLSANNIFFPGSNAVIDYMTIANTTYPLPQNANPSQTIVHLLGNYYSDDYQLIRTGATTFGLLNLQSGNLVQPQVTTTSNTQAITNITFAPGSNAVFALQDQNIDLGQARALMSNIILLS